jgi:acetamidase/formamidase
MKMHVTLFVLLVLAAPLRVADFTGDWLAQSANNPRDPQYARVMLRAEGLKLTGNWNESSLEGTITEDRVEFSIHGADRSVVGSFKGRMEGAALSGEVSMVAGTAGRGGSGPITWKLARAPQPPPGGPKTWDFEPKEFHGNYSAAIPPVLHIFPGDTVRSRSIDTSGPDAALPRSPGGNPETGPFYIEGALPGDTLVVKVNKLTLNRDTARSGNRVNGRAITPAYMRSAEYTADFNSEWKLDRKTGVAVLAHPTDRLKDYTVPLLPMIGCIGTAPPTGQSYRATDLGPFGGNLDYNQMGEGVTVYLPVFNAGALLFFGDMHAAMGDGELTGSALETSANLEFTVDLIKGYSTGNPRLENKDYIMSVGVAGSIQDALQIATTQLAEWLKHDYKLNDNEVAIVLGTALKYDVAELVDPHFSMVAKLPKSALATLK